MMKIKILKTILSYAIVVLIILSLPVPKQDGKKTSASLPLRLEDVRKIYPQTESYTQNRDKSYSVKSADGATVGNFIVSNDFLETNFGYAGEINTLIGFNGTTVEGVVLLDNVDSRSYVRKVTDSDFLTIWNGKDLSQLPLMNVDAVSGATRTSSAVIRAVKESSAGYLSVVASSKISIREILKASLFVLVILLSLIMTYKKGMQRYRIFYLIFLIVASGFVLQAMLSTALFSGWMKQGLAIGNSWMSVTLLLLAIGMPALGKNRYYCTYLCPMGALQELTGKLSPLKKHSLRILKFRYFNTNDIFLLLVIVAMYFPTDIDLSYAEPFTAFAVTIVGWGMLLFGLLVVILSLFFNRPWCAVCPTGCALNKLSLPNRSTEK